MSNLNDPLEITGDGVRAVRVAERAGAEHLGASLYRLEPGDEMVFHYHVHREELLLVLAGRLSLRTAAGWEELPEGEVVAFPRGESGAHGYRNDGETSVRVLMISEMDGPNISVYPDSNQIGVFDAGQRAQRRFGALFNVDDAVAAYGGVSEARIVPPAPGPRQTKHD
ncbi:MAG: cupin domain-containing protein [Gaiellaceae bacterium]